MRRTYLFLRALLYPLAAALVPCKVMNKDKFKNYDRGKIIICNHLSWTDIAYQIFWIPSAYKRFLSKKENGNNKCLKRFLDDVGVILVNREKPELSSLRECVNALNDGDTLSIYPEGTRNKVNTELQPFHLGAAMFALKGKVQVIPLAVHHRGKLFCKNYMGIGDPVDLSDLTEKRIGPETMDEATERFRAAIQKVKDELDVWVNDKGWRADRKRKRMEKRALKRQYKQAKREYAQSMRGK